jgi:hypothetical protein
MRGFLDYVHFIGLVGGIFLTIDAVANIQTIGHNVIGELLFALGFLVVSFIAYTFKNRV